MTTLAGLRNTQMMPLTDVPDLPVDAFRSAVIERIRAGQRLSAFFGLPERDAVMLLAVLTNDRQGTLELCRTVVADAYPALTPEAPQAHWFERELAEQWGLRPEGHPWLKPIRFQPPCRSVAGPSGSENAGPIQPGVTDYFRVEGDSVHEVAVGPVHAGIIEPGHFRFQCFGEQVLHLEIELGYQHRGVERALTGGPNPRTRHYMETLAGDTTIGHATAYALIMEALGRTAPPPRAQAIRAIALELERLANHTGDLGALANDVGYLPTAAYCGRIRGEFLNMTARWCGNRFGRNLVHPGGVRFDLDADQLHAFEQHLQEAYRDVQNAVSLLWESPSVLARFEGAGEVSHEDALALGLVGPAARGCGVKQDVRTDLPWGAYCVHNIPAVTWHTGDVHARARIRMFEMLHSYQFILDELHGLEAGPVSGGAGAPADGMLAVALVEGWRGEICHVAVTDSEGKFRRYKVVDPSFHNWMGLALALRGRQISDFPLCNKSFNLSYCGHDL